MRNLSVPQNAFEISGMSMGTKINFDFSPKSGLYDRGMRDMYGWGQRGGGELWKE